MKTTGSYGIETHGVRNLLGTLFALVVADGLISDFLISQGLGRELNPVLSAFMEQGTFLV